ncbi:DUF2169 domain-containing protein [Myxococcus sp. RHSTA-1-4]|uniref:DUF2169 family type VI secretion system accessory protein n=1 Tax=Myxococcus sp. RHSTA-1-4 TaxID=2874601 RepID=UPI001CBBECB8|nr:DUF2169 domain-containing protein [Myxococcus sp. RHSTA-1-4]
MENRSRFASEDFLSWDKEGREVLVVCVAGRFELPSAGRPTTQPLRVSEAQRPPPPADAYWGEPEHSSPRVEGQRVYTRPGTDVYVSGHAWAPGGRPTREAAVGVRVGACRQVARVWGPRVWQRGVLGLKPSTPRAFEKVPLHWELSAGGAGAPDNPVGCGVYASVSAAVDRPLPQLEDPERPLESPTQRVTPVGFGPVARHWPSRRALAGTYDERWVRTRAPLWPEDFDERFFQAAAPGLNAAGGLRGGEEVVLAGMHPDGKVEFHLPRVHLQVESRFRRRKETRALVLDGVHLEVDEGAVTLLWRAAVPVRRDLAEYEGSVVREEEGRP